jgi:hypothetical protein
LAGFEALVAGLDAETSGALKDADAAAGADRLAAASSTFHDGVKALALSPEAQTTLGRHLDALAEEYGRAWAEVMSGVVALHEIEGFPARDQAIEEMRTLLAGLGPCPVAGIAPATPEASPEPAASTAGPAAAEVLDDILRQKKRSIRPVSRARMRKAVDSLFEAHGETLAEVANAYPCVTFLTRRDARRWVADLYRNPGTSGPAEAALEFMARLLMTYEHVADPQARKALTRLADMAFDRAATVSISERAGRPLSEFATAARGFLEVNLNDPGFECGRVRTQDEPPQ